jgi:hypothetical protein
MMPRYFFDFASDGEAYDDPAGVEFDGDEEAVRQLLPVLAHSTHDFVPVNEQQTLSLVLRGPSGRQIARAVMAWRVERAS